jgi:hypothetical protein
MIFNLFILNIKDKQPPCSKYDSVEKDNKTGKIIHTFTMDKFGL